MDSDDAWDIARGGVTLDGDTIVVAIIDNGTTVNHPDLYPNHWFNRQEIPNNEEIRNRSNWSKCSPERPWSPYARELARAAAEAALRAEKRVLLIRRHVLA